MQKILEFVPKEACPHNVPKEGPPSKSAVLTAELAGVDETTSRKTSSKGCPMVGSCAKHYFRPSAEVVPVSWSCEVCVQIGTPHTDIKRSRYLDLLQLRSKNSI
jgi:hypothetical protein